LNRSTTCCPGRALRRILYAQQREDGPTLFLIGADAVNGEMLRAAVKVLLARESYAYTTLWESLTLSQKRFLTGLAAVPAGVKVFAGDFVSRHGLGSASNAQGAVQALLSKDAIDRDNGSFLITDRFFRLWIQSMQSA
jgi:hypothetical protein